jgi:hypothetical protein
LDFLVESEGGQREDFSARECAEVRDLPQKMAREAA